MESILYFNYPKIRMLHDSHVESRSLDFGDAKYEELEDGITSLTILSRVVRIE
jgi:hypothetical protein